MSFDGRHDLASNGCDKLRNVLLIIESSDTGGAETVFLNLVRNIESRGFRPHVGLLEYGWLYDEIVWMGLEPVRFRTDRRFDISLLKSLVKYIKKNKIALIHSHLFGINVYASIAGTITGIPTISTIHGAVDVNMKDSLKRIKFSIMNRCSRKVVYVSNSVMNHFHALKLADKSKSMVIYNGIDIDKYRGIGAVCVRKELGYSQDDLIIGSIGDIRPSKGYDVLLKAATILRNRVANIKFLIAGSETPLVDELKKLCLSWRIDDIVQFLGFRRDIPNILKTIDVFVLPSISEGFSLATAEAMAFGIPVIVTRCGGPEEIVTDREDGLLVEANNPEAIVDGVMTIIGDIKARARMSCEGRRTAEDRFSVQGMITRYVEMYEDLMEVRKMY